LTAQAGSNAAEIPVYDLRGLKCPLPVLKTRKRMSGLPSGTLVWVETDDPMALIDIPHFCNESGHRLLEKETMDGFHRFLIEKAA
jgi:tRNA 2-thiouridine synthesizing protein A